MKRKLQIRSNPKIPNFYILMKYEKSILVRLKYHLSEHLANKIHLKCRFGTSLGPVWSLSDWTGLLTETYRTSFTKLDWFKPVRPKKRSEWKSHLTLIGKFLGNFWGRFTGKLIHQKIMSTYSVFFFNSGASHRTFYWKTHPFEFFDWNHIWYVTFGLVEFSSKTISEISQKFAIRVKWLFHSDLFFGRTGLNQSNLVKLVR